MGHPTYHVNVIKLKINERLHGQVGYPTYLHVNRPLSPHESFTRCISFKLTYASHKLVPTSLKTQKLCSGLPELHMSIFKNKNERREESKYIIYLLNAK